MHTLVYLPVLIRAGCLLSPNALYTASLHPYYIICEILYVSNTPHQVHVVRVMFNR